MVRRGIVLEFRSCRQGCGLQNKSLARINFAIITQGITLVAPYCAIPRDYLSESPLLRAMGFLCHNMANWVRYPPPFSERFPPWRACKAEVRYPPLKRGISAILARYPMKTRQMGAIPPSAILSRKGIARYGGVSRTGPLRESQK